MNILEGITSECDGLIIICYKKLEQSDEKIKRKRSLITTLKGQRRKLKIVSINDYDIVKNLDDDYIILPNYSYPMKHSLKCSECNKVVLIFKNMYNK